jgi:hypothetical protein
MRERLELAKAEYHNNIHQGVWLNL